jgi:hypothetical protein
LKVLFLFLNKKIKFPWTIWFWVQTPSRASHCFLWQQPLRHCSIMVGFRNIFESVSQLVMGWIAITTTIWNKQEKLSLCLTTNWRNIYRLRFR